MSSRRPWTRRLYLQVRDVMMECIASGEWKPGFAVPNEHDLARNMGVSSVKWPPRIGQLVKLGSP